MLLQVGNKEIHLLTGCWECKIMNLRFMAILYIFTAMKPHLKFSVAIADLVDVGQRASVVLRPGLRRQAKLLDLLKLHLPVRTETKSNTRSRFEHPGHAVLKRQKHTSGWKLMLTETFLSHHCHCFLIKRNTISILALWVLLSSHINHSCEHLKSHSGVATVTFILCHITYIVCCVHFEQTHSFSQRSLVTAF